MNKQNRVTFYVGPEVEKTPAFAKKTLFVVGWQDTSMIDKHARENKVQHISLGAQNSFNMDWDTSNIRKTWDEQVTYLLDKGYWVTLSYPAHQHKTVLSMLNDGIWQSRLFVPVLSVNVPKLQTSNPNLSIKMDDNSGSESPGIWTMHFNEVTDSNRFTDWNEYEFVPVSGEPDILVNDIEIMAQSKEIKMVETSHHSVFHLEIPSENSDVLKEVVDNFNNTELGLDTKPTTALKPDTENEIIMTSSNVTPEVAAAAYAEGAKIDTLGETASKKPKGRK